MSDCTPGDGGPGTGAGAGPVPERSHPLARALERWLRLVVRRPRTVVATALLLALLAGAYALEHLGVETSTTDMFDPSLQWRRNHARFTAAFPVLSDNLTIVIDAMAPELAFRARDELARALEEDRRHFAWTYRPDGEPFLQRNALLYLDLEELRSLSDRLARAQPLIATLSRDRSLRGLLELLRQIREAEIDPDAIALERFLGSVRTSLEAALEGRFHRMSWLELMQSEEEARDPESRRTFVVAHPLPDEEGLFPLTGPLAALRTTVASLGLLPSQGIRVRVTGGVALSHEELRSALRGGMTAAGAAFLVVAAVLAWGLRSWRLVVASLVTLAVGLAWTGAFAAWAVGRLNLISVAFAVLYIGLGIDYAIHLSLRYRELAARGLGPGAAFPRAARDVATSLVVCAVTTGIGFYAFLPTAFRGVSELGLISGTGVFISLLASLTVLPALIALLEGGHAPAPGGAPASAPPGEKGRPRWERRLARPVLVGTGLLALGAALGLPRVWFDANPLNLQNPDTEAFRTYRELMGASGRPSWPINVLARGPGEARALIPRLQALPEVDEVQSVFDYVPPAQEEKLLVIDEMALILGPVLEEQETEEESAGLRLARARAALTRLLAVLSREGSPPGDPWAGLRAVLEELRGALEGAQGPAVLERARASVLATLPQALDWLATALEASPFTLADLPDVIRVRWVSPNGLYRLRATPSGDLFDPHDLQAFVEAVRTLAPEATGTPVVNLEAARSVIRAFVEAFAGAGVLVALVLVLALRRVGDVVLIYGTLLLASLLTVGTMAWLGIPFNFANVIGLPLLLGIGVDNGIHMVHRARYAPAGAGGLLRTSTARAVVTSTLTTLGGFGNLALSEHRGMASLGLVLALGLAATLLVTLLVLPVLIERMMGKGSGQGAHGGGGR